MNALKQKANFCRFSPGCTTATTDKDPGKKPPLWLKLESEWSSWWGALFSEKILTLCGCKLTFPKDRTFCYLDWIFFSELLSKPLFSFSQRWNVVGLVKESLQKAKERWCCSVKCLRITSIKLLGWTCYNIYSQLQSICFTKTPAPFPMFVAILPSIIMLLVSVRDQVWYSARYKTCPLILVGYFQT